MSDSGTERPIPPITFAGKLKPESSVPFAKHLTTAFTDRVIEAQQDGAMLDPDELRAWKKVLSAADVDSVTKAGIPLDKTLSGIAGLIDKMERNIPTN